MKSHHPLQMLLCLAVLSAAMAGAVTLAHAEVEGGVEETEILKPPVHIVVDPNEAAPIHRAVDDLTRDIEKVLGQSPTVVDSLADVPESFTALVVVGPAWHDSGLAIAEDITGNEAHGVYVAQGDTGPHVVMHGSDMRGTIYAIYTFSEHCLGIPPLWFWASWQPEKKEQIELPANFDLRFDPPQVRWRAWFPNDQRQLSPWLRQSQENEDALAEAMLRLKMNMIDVLSFVDANYSELYDLSRYGDMAKRFGLALTCTHTAPLGAHPSQTRWDRYWTRIRDVDAPPERSIYDVESLKEYWTYYIEAGIHHDLEIVWPIAFRGGGDLGFWQGDNYEDPGSDEDRAQVIQDMLNEQVALLKSVTEQDEPPMRVTLYNEKSDFVAEGLLELPDEQSLIYNFVAARRDHYPPPDLLQFDFDPEQLVGYYFNYQFTSTGSHIVQAEGPRKMEQNFRTVDDESPTGVEVAVVNAGNIREHVMELAAHAEMMWDFEAYDSSQFLREFSETYFGSNYAERIARFTEEYYASYWQQKPGVLEDFERQFIFQDLRLHRAMRILIPELKKDDPSLDAFWGDDWFRIDLEAHDVQTETEAVALGMRQSLRRLIPLTREADVIYNALPASRGTFFNDNFRVQAYFLRHATEVVYYLAEALIAEVNQLPGRRARNIRLAAQSGEAMEAILADAEHGIFEGWYEPLRDPDISSNFRIRQRRDELQELLEDDSTETLLLWNDFEVKHKAFPKQLVSFESN